MGTNFENREKRRYEETVDRTKVRGFGYECEDMFTPKRGLRAAIGEPFLPRVEPRPPRQDSKPNGDWPATGRGANPSSNLGDKASDLLRGERPNFSNRLFTDEGDSREDAEQLYYLNPKDNILLNKVNR